MIKGDIDNRPVSKLIIVFETLFITFTNSSRAKFDLAIRKGQWIKALKQIELNDLILKHLYDLTYRRGFNVDVVTYIDPEFAEVLDKFLEEEDLPVGKAFFSTPERMARSITNRPDIAAIFDGDINRIFTYGSKGRIVNQATPEFL